ncbi:MAG: hypothetical protein ACKVQV_01325, partial [Bacteroidia bacterium]
GFPNGTWNQSSFNEGAGSPFDGFRWRSNPGVVFNYIWIKNYATDNSAYPSANDVLFDHIVVAKKYIGPIFNPPCTTPIISSFSPTAASTGSTISILGTGFNNTTTLSINGITLPFSVVNDNLINTTIPTNATAGQIIIGNACGVDTSTTTFSVLPNETPITVKLFLEGYYQNGQMISAVGDTTTPIANCDTIILSLADSSSPYQIMYSDTQLLKTSGFATFYFPQAVNNNSYYFVIRHRNTIETWSKKPISITPSLSIFDLTASTTPTATTTVDINNVVMTNPKLLFGITYDCRSSLTVSNYGLAGYHNTNGSWNSNIDSIFNDFPMSTLRYPANGIMQGFNWKKSIGPIPLRVPQKIFAQQSTPAQVFEFGFDEFMAMTESRGVNGSDVQIMVPIYDSAVVWSMPAQTQAAVPYVAQSNADWVEYCNSPNDGSNPGGGIDWAAVRAANGHPQPYGIKIWNMGNEPYTANEFGASATGVNNYINIIVPIINAMRAIDPTIQITVTATGRHNSAWTTTLLNSTSLQGKIYGLNVHYFMTEQIIGNTIPYGVDTVTENLIPLAAAALSKGYKLLVGDHAHAILGTTPSQATQDLAMQWQGANLTSDFILTMSQIKNIERSNFWVYGLTTNTWHPIRKNSNGTFTLMPVAQLYKILTPLFLDKSVSVTNTSVPASDGNVYSVKSSAFISNDLTKLNVISVNRDKLNSSLLFVNGFTNYHLNNAKLLTATSLSSDIINETTINADINDNFTLPPMSVIILEYSTN